MNIFIKAIFPLVIFFWSSMSYAIDIHHERGVTSFDNIPQKVVTLDWAATEAVLALGVTPVGIADTQGYRDWVAYPELPASVKDVGNRAEPNIELLSQLKPDVIVISSYLNPAYEALSKVAPVIVFTTYNANKKPLEQAQAMTRSLGQLLGRSEQAEQVINQTQAKLTMNGTRVRESGKTEASLLFVRFINEKTLRIHGSGSLMGDVVQVMGLNNAWQQNNNDWGFSTVEISKLAEYQQSQLIIFGPITSQEQSKLMNSPLWNAMAFSKNNTYHILPPIWTFGGLIAAQRMSDHLTELLTAP